MAATTVNKLVYELLELRRATITDTDTLTFRMVLDWINTQRARLVKQQYIDKGFHNIDDTLIQDLGTIALEQVYSNDLSIDDDNPMLRTAVDIPVAIESRTGYSALTRVGPPDKLSINYQVIKYDRGIVAGNGHFSGNSIFAFPYGGKIYLTSKSGYHLTQTYVNIRGVFQNPIEAALLGDATWTYDDQYPMNQSMVDQLKILIIKEKFGLAMLQPQDKTDDDLDNPTNNADVQKR